MAKIKKELLNNIKNEIKMAEKLVTDLVIPQMNEAVSRYTSKHVPTTLDRDDEINLNEIYPIIQFELPAIFFRNPKVFLKPRNKNFVAKRMNPQTGRKEEVFLDATKSAKTQESLLNYIIDQIGYKKEARRVLQDALMFKYGVMLHGYKGEFGMTEEQDITIDKEQLFAKRISPKDFIFDPKVNLSNLDEAEWCGRSFQVLLRDIQEDDKLSVEKKLRGKPGFGTIVDMQRPNERGSDTRNTSSRARTLLDYTDPAFQDRARFLTVYEIFVRPTKKEKRNGEKGKVLLLTDEQETPLRENPWPYKAKGFPFEVLMFNEVPDQNFGLSDLEVYGPIADQKNLIMNLQARNAESNSKNMVFFDKSEMDEEDIAKIEEGEQNVIGLNGNVNGKVVSLSLGGNASSELYRHEQSVQANLDDKSGVSELKRGFIRSGEESATSVQIRNAGASARPAYRQDLMRDFLKESFTYLNNLNQQFMTIKDAVRIMGTLDIEWSDNPTKEEIQADVDIEVDAISMAPESPEKELQENKMVLDLMTQALVVPEIRTKLQQEGKTVNLSPLIENMLMRLKIRDPEVFRSLRAEESKGFASVAELQAAQANVEAIAQGAQLPSPPEEGQDHSARLGVYAAVLRLQQLEGKVNEVLMQLAEVQQALAAEESKKEAPQGGQSVGLSKAKTQST